MNDFVTSYIGHLENIGVLTYADDPKVETFHYTIKNNVKNHIYYTTSSLIRKGFKY